MAKSPDPPNPPNYSRPYHPPDTSAPDDRILAALQHRISLTSLSDLSTALSDRFSGTWSSWHRFLARYLSGENVFLTRTKEDQLGTFLSIPARPAQLTPIRQRLYLVRYLNSYGVLKSSTFVRPGAALTRVRAAQSAGTFVELVVGVATWTPLTVASLAKHVSPERGGTRITRQQKIETGLCKNGRHVLAEVGKRPGYGCQGCYAEYRLRHPHNQRKSQKRYGRGRRANGELTLLGLTVWQRTVYMALKNHGDWANWRRVIDLVGRDMTPRNAGSAMSVTLNSLYRQHLLEVKGSGKVKWFRVKEIPGSE